MTFPMPTQIKCLECDRVGWSDEMGMRNGHYLCAKCMYPDLDLSYINSYAQKS